MVHKCPPPFIQPTQRSKHADEHLVTICTKSTQAAPDPKPKLKHKPRVKPKSESVRRRFHHSNADHWWPAINVVLVLVLLMC